MPFINGAQCGIANVNDKDLKHLFYKYVISQNRSTFCSVCLPQLLEDLLKTLNLLDYINLKRILLLEERTSLTTQLHNFWLEIPQIYTYL